MNRKTGMKLVTKIFDNNKIQNQRQENYNIYRFSVREWLFYVLLGSSCIGLVSICFYDSYVTFFLFLPLLYPYLKRKQQLLCKKRKHQLEREFREMILSVAANLQAGYSVENAFHEAYKDVVMLYGKESTMAKESYLLLQRLQNNQQLESILIDLAKRSGVEDIQDFAEIFGIAKRSGGDIRAVIANTAHILGEKAEVRREIQTIMSEKTLEQKIMRAMPFVFIGYISLTTRGYFNSLYHNLMGIGIMTGCLLIYAIASRLSDKILDIEI